MIIEPSVYNEIMKRSRKGMAFLPVLLITFVLGIAGYFVYQNSPLKNNKQEDGTMEQIEILSTDDWKEVANDGVYFKIPPDASCDDENFCGKVSYSQKYILHGVPRTIYIKVHYDTRNSRKKQFIATHANVTGCKPIYQEAMFGSINALQIAIDGGWCQGNIGGITTVIGRKLVTFDGGLTYNSNNEINRWRIRDTLISTFSTTR